ncbi:MAG: DHH family phosphoesterase, partial [Candidatus Hecatellaceae archaeon]
MKPSLKRLRSLLRKAKPKHAIVFCHHNADPDAVFSASLLAKLIRKLKPGVRCEIVAVEGPSSLSKLLMEKAPVKLAEAPRLERADLLLLVDTSTVEQLGEWKLKVKSSGKPLIVVDHHTVHPETRKLASLLLVDPEASSACEVVYSLCKEAEVKISRREALGLMFGIIHETRGLRYASAGTFKTLAELAGLGVKPAEAFRAMSEPLSRSERIARIKAAGRAEIHELGEWL